MIAVSYTHLDVYKRQRIVVIGKTHEVRGRVRLTPNAEVIDAKGKVVLPGFVDSHTHLAVSYTHLDVYKRQVQA